MSPSNLHDREMELRLPNLNSKNLVLYNISNLMLASWFILLVQFSLVEVKAKEDFPLLFSNLFVFRKTHAEPIGHYFFYAAVDLQCSAFQ